MQYTLADSVHCLHCASKLFREIFLFQSSFSFFLSASSARSGLDAVMESEFVIVSCQNNDDHIKTSPWLSSGALSVLSTAVTQSDFISSIRDLYRFDICPNRMSEKSFVTA